MQRYTTQLLQQQWLNEEVIALQLKKVAQWQAGQYLKIIHPDFPYAFFTIANTVSDDFIELHIQVGDNNSDSRKLIEFVQRSEDIEIELPMGLVHPAQFTHGGPLIMVASGTGFTQLKSITEHYLQHQSDRPIYLFWTVQHLHELYYAKQAEAWEVEHAHVSFTAIVSKHQHWDKRHCLLKEAIETEVPDLSEADIVICGSPTMVSGLMEELQAHPLLRENYHSDAFEFS